jgi:hypothetical protein
MTFLRFLESDTLFREDGLTTTLFRRYTRVVAMRYLWDTLAVVLNELKVIRFSNRDLKIRIH